MVVLLFVGRVSSSDTKGELTSHFNGSGDELLVMFKLMLVTFLAC